MEYIQEPKELGFTLEPPVGFYRIFIRCAILSTEAGKQRWTFLLDRQFFASLRFDFIFTFCRRISTISHSPNLLFPSFEVKIFQLTSVSWFCL